MPDSDQAQTPDAPERVDEVTRALTDLSLLLDAEEELIRVLQRGVDQATWAIPSADLVSVTVVRDDRAETIAANDERVRAIDSQQYAAGEGPYLEAARSSETVRANVERATALWPKFARIARGAGMASFLSSPLIIADKFAGSLNLYSAQPHGFGDLDEALLRLYTTAAAAAIANARRYAEARAGGEPRPRAAVPRRDRSGHRGPGSRPGRQPGAGLQQHVPPVAEQQHQAARHRRADRGAGPPSPGVAA